MWFDGIRQQNTIYIASVSRGKDSTAMLRAIQLLNFPLDAICAVDVWFDEETPAELPPMVAFKDEWDKKCFENFGVPVTRLCAHKRENLTRIAPNEKHTRANFTAEEKRGSSAETMSDSLCYWEHGAKNSNMRKLTYCDIFYRKITRTREIEREKAWRDSYPRVGNQSIMGFPLQRGSWCNSDLKKSAIKYIRFPSSARELVYWTQDNGNQSRDFQQDGLNSALETQDCSSRFPFSNMPQNEGQKINIVHYIGIAADEPNRIARHMPKADMVMPLVQIGWDEDLCGLEAQCLDMLSPTYETGERDGCWFCHNQGVSQLRKLRKDYPELWAKLMKLDLESPVTFHADGHTVHDFDRRFELEDLGLISDSKFKWKNVENPPLLFLEQQNNI